jgi:hypothetical protein
MAQPMLNLGGDLSPEQQIQQQQIARQQKMAELLMQQGQQTPQGQMVGNRFVAPSFFQYAAPLLQGYVGRKELEKVEGEQLKLAKELREQGVQETQRLMNVFGGRPAIPEQVTEMAGPYGMSGEGQNIPMPTASIAAQPTIEANPKLAFAEALNMQSPQARALLPFIATEAFKKPKYKEITQYNEKTGNTENYRYDENSPDPRSTLQFIGISKPAISPEAQIRFGDEGINIPAQFKGGAVGQPQGQPSTMPVAGAQTQPKVETKTTPVTLQRFGYDPFQGPELPKNVFGKDARAIQLEQKKPITGDAAKTVSGATNYMDALTKYKDYVDTLTATDLANPQVRIALNTKHKQVLLTGKEANNLGVLNGGDERILNAVMPNYSDILVTKNTLGKVIQDQREFGSGAIVAQYRTSEKAVPERLRKYVDIDIPTKTESKNVVNDIQSQLRSKGIPYQPKLYEYRVNPDGSVDRKRKIL